jgi:hypothetical protein
MVWRWRSAGCSQVFSGLWGILLRVTGNLTTIFKMSALQNFRDQSVFLEVLQSTSDVLVRKVCISQWIEHYSYGFLLCGATSFSGWISIFWRNLLPPSLHPFCPEEVGNRYLQTLLPTYYIVELKKKNLRGLSPRANYTDRATAACRRSDCQLVRIEGARWSGWRIPPAVFLGFLDRSRYCTPKVL